MINPEVTKYQNNLHKFTFYLDKPGTIPIYTFSDVHFDNPKCNRSLFFKHMDQMVAEEGFCTITGDFLCLMQGKYDPRRSKSNIRPEHNKDNYLDLVINDTAEKIAPYAKHILAISEGNHESSVSQRNETHILTRLVERINTIAGSNIQILPYSGYFILCFAMNKTSRRSLTYAYHHGKWGGVITKGTMSAMRFAAMYPDADIVVSGHTHDGWIIPIPRIKISSTRQNVTINNQWHAKSGTYKEEFLEGKGWAVEKIVMPKFLGCIRCEIKIKRKDSTPLPTLSLISS